jgi:hypothetical protein
VTTKKKKQILTTPPGDRQLIVTRVAAEIIGCSMSNVRWLRDTGRVMAWRLGPRTVAYDLAEIEAYKKRTEADRAAARRKGRRGMGKPREGFRGV